MKDLLKNKFREAFKKKTESLTAVIPTLDPPPLIFDRLSFFLLLGVCFFIDRVVE